MTMDIAAIRKSAVEWNAKLHVAETQRWPDWKIQPFQIIWLCDEITRLKNAVGEGAALVNILDYLFSETAGWEGGAPAMFVDARQKWRDALHAWVRND